MSQLQQITEQITHVGSISFEDVRDHAAIIGLSVLPATVMLSAIDYFRHPEAKEEGIGGVDLTILEEVKNVKGSHFRAHRKRWGLPMIAAAGVALLAPQYMNPTVEISETDAASATVLIIDQSYPMQYTNDMDGGASRTSAVNAGVANAVNTLPEQIKIGAVTYGATAEIPKQAELGTDRGSLIAGITGSTVDQNGLNISAALETTQNIFAGNTDITAENVIIITDGLTENGKAPEVKSDLKEIVESGKNVTVIITGTADGSYKTTEFAHESTPSGATAEAYSGVDGVTVLNADTTQELTDQIHNTVDAQTTTKERKPFTLLTLAGAGVLGMAFVGTIRKAFKRDK